MMMADPTGDGGGGEKWSDNASIFSDAENKVLD